MTRFNPWNLLAQSIWGSFLGAIFGVFVYFLFSSFFWKQDVALQNWFASVTHAHDSLGVPWGLCMLSMLIFAVAGLAVALFRAIKSAANSA